MFVKKPVIEYSIMEDEVNFVAWGDPIFSEIAKREIVKKRDVPSVLNNIFGHYYFVLKDKTNDKLYVGTSFFSILPLYYIKVGNFIHISDSPTTVKKPDESIFNKRFLLENILFKYNLFNNSTITGVELLPSNHFLLIDKSNLEILRHTSIEDYFQPKPTPWRKSVDDISDLFVERSKIYFPDEHYYNALTGGFDGRTLVSAGLNARKDFSTYCFGSRNADDVKIAQRLSENADIPFMNIDLDEKYSTNHSLINGLEFIEDSDGCGTFSRAHYLYASKQIANRTKYIITGNFGSEIFRAAHTTGSMLSKNLYNLFAAKNFDEAIDKLRDSFEWGYLNRGGFNLEWESLVEDLKKLPCFDPQYSDFTKNQQFYKVVFEEVFRKYFGAEIVNQNKYVKNRTPFLDINFFKAILETELSGVYSDYYTHNPFKRFKGQFLYAHLIRNLYPAFANEKTDKGYAPKDLLTVHGNLKVAFSFFNKVMNNSKPTIIDPYGVNAAFKTNQDFWKNIRFDINLFNPATCESGFKAFPLNRDSFFVLLSQAWWYNHLIK